ncbi:MAG: class I SAM-dependent methyltransferase [Gemmatimonadales bacterium]|jgi:ubiquinone/menaquinone biosynthesis C-methylase UbiE
MMRNRVLAVLLLAVVILPTTARAQAERTSRDSWQRVDDVFVALDVDEGETIADVGAGSGFFSFRLSPRVGPEGRVLAVDIDAHVLRRLREEARREGFNNIETIVSEPDDPLLQEQSVDGILVVNAYHEMVEHEAMLGRFRQALRPGGRLVLLDMPPRDSTVSRERQVAAHDIAIGIVARELATAGFEVVEEHPNFIRSGRRSQWMLVATVPGGP